MLWACVLEFGEPRPRGTVLIQEDLEQWVIEFSSVCHPKSVMKFGRRGKLSPKYIGSFEIFRSVGEVSYGLALPSMCSAIHLVFHVSMLHQYVLDESHVLQYDVVELDNSLTFVEEPLVILARYLLWLRLRVIHVVKVHWRHRPIEESTWQTEHDIQEQLPSLFE
ncbi:hypothetical protein MTR67_026378 [Solanum verrucosum]|uniref:Tf2-1-like SH3-like domain-containing protein n=1 Tax=Solanum verrucosum TaxID=315347 RepID=A0AAF0TZR1_SOLVR|nr:hypothetical protein MTR67_026378 [Solanum verrucosum]